MKLLHYIKNGPAESLQLGEPHLFHVDTCQRQIWITDHEPATAPQNMSTYAGEAAYEKLLSIACGLESRIIGETEIFAQLKTAWHEHHESAHQASDTDALLSALFEDTKFIRSNYISGIGGQSYGTLVRKTISPNDGSHILIAGTGELAESIAPLLTQWKMTLTNRSLDKAHGLAQKLTQQGADVGVLTPASANLLAPHLSVTDLIVCRPFDQNADQRYARLPALKSFIHLGAAREELATLSFAKRIRTVGLDDIFALQASQDELRELQVTRARQACRERATLRSLGTSVTLPHGWEDLAAFGQS